ncbi:hypothetical protein Y032_0310g2100 [Ancylostoma ceylanicum]|uniref:Uncharacterized protein n=1 Tax=Ancylostoma ceylanicum TaxID=53326 RepID=A0A016S346_9BILA|nr:hypothetical protein Y032_0310g2100 [Ancylostoma ceylanicum]
MKQRETAGRREMKAPFSMRPKRGRIFRGGYTRVTPRNPVDGAHFIHYTVHYSIHYTMHSARTRVAYKINSVNWRGGHQNGYAPIRVHSSISAGRRLFFVFNLPL